ncbi:MAG: heavy metal-binding domain-containing protein [Candidatus Neomarinimicrobiota bacterium]
MKRVHILFVSLLWVGFFACAQEKKGEETEGPPAVAEEPAAEVAQGEKIMYYTCPMEAHKHVHSQEAGNCPDCGMDLVSVVQTDGTDFEFYTCPMPEHSHVRHSEPGECDECGMKLLPVKLGKT